MPLFKVELKGPFVVLCGEGEGSELIASLTMGDICTKDGDYKMTEIRSKSQIPKDWSDAIPFSRNQSDPEISHALDNLTCEQLVKRPLVATTCDQCNQTVQTKGY